MKCKNCGANYKTMELMCPYCRTENLMGKIWKAERTEAEREYERKRKEMGSFASVYVVDRILTRSIVVVILMFVILFAGVHIVSCIWEGSAEIKVDLNSDAYETKLSEFYKNEKYAEMYAYIHEENIPGQEYYGYMQAALLNNEYESYLCNKYIFMDMSVEEKLEDDYYLEYAILDSIDVYKLECGVYSELNPMNEELYDKYKKEIMSFWKGILQLDDETIKMFTDEDSYMYSSDIDTIVDKIKERYRVENEQE